MLLSGHHKNIEEWRYEQSMQCLQEFLNNLLPVTLGNIVGGVVFVALPLYLIYRNKNKAEA